MKSVKVFLAIVLALQGACLLFSQQAPSLTPDQQDQFDSQKLSVAGYRVVTTSQYGITGDSGFGPSSTNWDASKGYDKINEPDFLRTVGLDKEALESQSHLTTKSAVEIGGGVAMAVGLGLMFLPLIAPPQTTDSYGYTSTDWTLSMDYIIAGTIVGLGGGVLFYIGRGMPKNITPYGRAATLADKYNVQLLIKITGKAQKRLGLI